MATHVRDPLALLLTGKFLVFDGPDGCGKSTLRDRMHTWLSTEPNWVTTVCVREPGGTVVGEAIREVLLHKQFGTGHEMHPYAETLLFMAARVQLLFEQIQPALTRNTTVLSDRFVSSTLAYQGAEGVSWEHIVAVAKLVIPPECWPACTVILDLPTSVSEARRAVKAPDPDRIEARDEEFRQQVRLNYVKQAAIYPATCVLVDASGTPEETFQRTCKALLKFFNRRLT